MDSYFYYTIATIKTNPSRASFTQLQSVSLRDSGGGRGSAFHFTFQDGEKWLKILISFIQPIRLSAVHIYQPHGLTQSMYMYTLYHTLCYFMLQSLAIY